MGVVAWFLGLLGAGLGAYTIGAALERAQEVRMQQRIQELREAIASDKVKLAELSAEDLAAVREATVKALNAAGQVYQGERALMDKVNAENKARMGLRLAP